MTDNLPKDVAQMPPHKQRAYQVNEKIGHLGRAGTPELHQVLGRQTNDALNSIALMLHDKGLHREPIWSWTYEYDVNELETVKLAFETKVQSNGLFISAGLGDGVPDRLLLKKDIKYKGKAAQDNFSEHDETQGTGKNAGQNIGV